MPKNILKAKEEKEIKAEAEAKVKASLQKRSSKPKAAKKPSASKAEKEEKKEPKVTVTLKDVAKSLVKELKQEEADEKEEEKEKQGGLREKVEQVGSPVLFGVGAGTEEFASTTEIPLPLGTQRAPRNLEGAVEVAPMRRIGAEEEEEEKVSYGRKAAMYEPSKTPEIVPIKYDLTQELKDVFDVEHEAFGRNEPVAIAPYFKKALQTDVYDSLEKKSVQYESRVDETRIERESKLYEMKKAMSKKEGKKE